MSFLASSPNTPASCLLPMREGRGGVYCLIIAVVIIKSILLIVDHRPAFHFGDSGAYLATALVKWIPPDRSFTYGFLLRPLVLTTHSLYPLVFLQTAGSAVSSVIVGLLLRRYFCASWIAATVFASLCAIEPLQLMSERFVMTEAFATFGFALFVWACCVYLDTHRTWALVVCQSIGVLLVSLRYSFLPLVLSLSVLLPALEAMRRPLSKGAKPLFIRMVLAVAISQTLLCGYRHLYGFLASTKPVYLSRDGQFLIADVAPLVIPEDFPIAGERLHLFEKITVPRASIDDRRLQRWLPGGICDAVLQVARSDEDLANKLAKKTALRTIRRDPFGVMRLAAATYREFFQYDKVSWALKLDSGYFVGPTANDVAMIKRWFGVDANDRGFDSITKRWERTATPWCWLVVALPLIYGMEIAWNWLRASRADLLLLFSAVCILASAIGPVEIANPRYLTPLPWLSILILGVMSSRLFVRNAQMAGTIRSGFRL